MIKNLWEKAKKRYQEDKGFQAIVITTVGGIIVFGCGYLNGRLGGYFSGKKDAFKEVQKILNETASSGDLPVFNIEEAAERISKDVGIASETIVDILRRETELLVEQGIATMNNSPDNVMVSLFKKI